MSIQEARGLYNIQKADQFSQTNWKFLAEIIFQDKSIFVSNRLAKIREFINFPKVIESMFAAELFPDSTPPRLLVADSMLETHEELREKHPSTAPRLSGDLIRLKQFPFAFFTMDAITKNVRQLPTKAQVPQVVEWLLSQNIVPLDAEMNLVFV